MLIPVLIGPQELLLQADVYMKENYGLRASMIVDESARYIHIYIKDTVTTLEGDLHEGIDSVMISLRIGGSDAVN